MSIMTGLMSVLLCSEEESNDELVRAKVMDAVKKHCNNDGKVIDDIQSKVAWIYWNTEK